jgi:hypothetical protein
MKCGRLLSAIIKGADFRTAVCVKAGTAEYRGGCIYFFRSFFAHFLLFNAP